MADLISFTRALMPRNGIIDLPPRADPIRGPEPKKVVWAKAVLWVYRDYEERWCVRKEGGDVERAFANRLTALEFARTLGMAAGSYRIFIELKDGRVVEEHFKTR